MTRCYWVLNYDPPCHVTVIPLSPDHDHRRKLFVPAIPGVPLHFPHLRGCSNMRETASQHSESIRALPRQYFPARGIYRVPHPDDFVYRPALNISQLVDLLISTASDASMPSMPTGRARNALYPQLPYRPRSRESMLKHPHLLPTVERAMRTIKILYGRRCTTPTSVRISKSPLQKASSSSHTRLKSITITRFLKILHPDILLPENRTKIGFQTSRTWRKRSSFSAAL
ncbi:hypothetical protein B0H13DRAFT_273606 [Mycena leptocephala]|nr:hypothetical protein B0H13DRAFT_273606 [Mycena leptocephala]